MKSTVCLIVALAFVVGMTLALQSCAGLSLSLTSPWGDVTSVNGVTKVMPLPIILTAAQPVVLPTK